MFQTDAVNVCLSSVILKFCMSLYIVYGEDYDTILQRLEKIAKISLIILVDPNRTVICRLATLSDKITQK